MKLIPCPTCGREAVGPKSDAFPNGAPVAFGRFTGGHSPIVVKCFRCMRAFKLDVLTYNGLPELQADQVKDLGLG